MLDRAATLFPAFRTVSNSLARFENAGGLIRVFSKADDLRAVLGELEIASNRGKIILPVRIDDVPPSASLEFYVRPIHWFDAELAFR